MLTSDSFDGRIVDPRQHLSRCVELPGISRLAARGTNFVAAYSHSPVCGPSRVAALTSRYVHDTGTWNNYQELPRDVTGALDTRCVSLYGAAQCGAWADAHPVPSGLLFDAAAAAGYEVSVHAKVDVGANAPARYNNAADQVDHTGPELRCVPRGAGLLRNSMAWDGWSADETNDDAFGDDARTTNETIAWLRARAANASDTRPWFVYTGLNIPHPPFVTGPKWLAAVNASNVHAPWAPDTPDALHPYDWHMSVSKGCTEPQNSPADMLKCKTTYLGMCAQADAFHAAVLDELVALGWENNTLVIFWSDHSEMAFDARQVLKDSFREGSTRVPMIFAGPGVAAGRTITAPASLLDLWPTLADPTLGTGIAPPLGARGFSLAPSLAADHAPLPRTANYVVGEFFGENSDTGAFFIVQDEWKYIAYGMSFPWFRSYTPQLFNLTDDPLEMVNRATARPEIVAALDALLITALNESYHAIDARVMENDQLIFRNYMFPRNATVSEMQAAFKQVYKGFDDSDWARVLLWNQTQPQFD